LTVTTLTKVEMIGKVVTLIHFSIKSGVAVIGQNRLDMMSSGNIGFVLISSETSENTVQNLKKKFGEQTAMRIEWGTELGKLIGKEGVKVIGFTKSELQRQIVKLIKSCEEI